MPSNADAKIEVEVQGSPLGSGKLNDSGDHKTFPTPATLISEYEGVKPVILPNGIIAAEKTTTAVSGSNDKIDVPKAIAKLNGINNVTVTASIDLSVARAATNVASISSVTINAAGNFVMVKGVDSADANFDLTGGYGGAGQPPYIPIDSILVAQITSTGNAPAVILSTDINQIRGSSREDALYPPYEIDYFGGDIVFELPLLLSHTGGVTKAIHAEVAEVVFLEQRKSDAFVPASRTSSSASTQHYSGSTGKEERGFNSTATFSVVMENGIDSDPITLAEDEIAMVRYTQDRNKTPYSLSRGRLNYTTANAAAENPIASVTIACLEPTRTFST